MGFALRVFLKLVFEMTGFFFLCWLKTLLFWNPRVSVRLLPWSTARDYIPWVVGFEGRTIDQAGSGTGYLQLATWKLNLAYLWEAPCKNEKREHQAIFRTCNYKGTSRQNQEVKECPVLSHKLRVRCDILGWDQPKYHHRLKPTFSGIKFCMCRFSYWHAFIISKTC